MHTPRNALRGGVAACCLVLAAEGGAAQRASLHGQVVNSDGHAVGHAFVEIRALDRAALADSSGLFRFDSLTAGRLFLHIQSFGFLEDSVEVVVDDGGTQVILPILETPMPPAFAPDTTPHSFTGGVRLGLGFGASRNQLPKLRVLLETEVEYSILGFKIDARMTRSAGRLDLEILGVRSPAIGPTAMGPATGSGVLDTPIDGPPDTLIIRYRSEADRYLIRRTASHAFIRPLEASFTSIRADSLELANPGTVRVRCAPAGYPIEDCERFVADLISVGMRSDTLTPDPETPMTRAFGNTLSETVHDPRQRWLIAHGLIERDIGRLLEAAEAFTAPRGGDKRAHVAIDTWDSRSIQCWEGRCGSRN